MYWWFVFYLIGVVVAGVVEWIIFIPWDNPNYTNRKIRNEILSALPFVVFSWVIPVSVMLVFLLIIIKEKN